MAVKRVGIKEFKDRATQLLASGEPLVVERHGKTIGYYTPIKAPDPVALREAQNAFNEKMEEVARKLGISVEALEDELFGAPPQEVAEENTNASLSAGRL
ncbi:hypothetical protein [Deinococcus planocerae]|uniref:hypothetical protein n=1 Tax=Deinococcus planocerae TaxID=1737569 RepID=UPI000C7F60BE|nr:hypothetical protein [Deinococcus planocerae]